MASLLVGKIYVAPPVTHALPNSQRAEVGRMDVDNPPVFASLFKDDCPPAESVCILQMKRDDGGVLEPLETQVFRLNRQIGRMRFLLARCIEDALKHRFDLGFIVRSSWRLSRWREEESGVFGKTLTESFPVQVPERF